jgi:hypothetical protein
MRRPKTSKILLIATLSLSACSGNPPKMERQIKLWAGTPERKAICRLTNESITDWAQAIAQHTRTKLFASKVINRVMVAYRTECVAADSNDFKRYAGISFDDLRVLLQYQENLLYSCKKWKD